MPDIQDILILWIVRFGEDCVWDEAVAHNREDKFVGAWYTALSNAGLLKAYTAGDTGLRIRVVEQEETCSGKQAPK